MKIEQAYFILRPTLKKVPGHFLKNLRHFSQSSLKYCNLRNTLIKIPEIHVSKLPAKSVIIIYWTKNIRQIITDFLHTLDRDEEEAEEDED